MSKSSEEDFDTDNKNKVPVDPVETTVGQASDAKFPSPIPPIGRNGNINDLSGIPPRPVPLGPSGPLGIPPRPGQPWPIPPQPNRPEGQPQLAPPRPGQPWPIPPQPNRPEGQPQLAPPRPGQPWPIPPQPSGVNRDPSNQYPDFSQGGFANRPGNFNNYGQQGPTSYTSSGENLLIGERTEAPRQGWRHIAYKAHFPVKKSTKELIYDRKIATINKFLRKPVVIGVFSFKGGVGKSTVSTCLGSTFASLRSNVGSVVGLDTAHYGSLAFRISKQEPVYNIRTFLTDDNLRGPSDTAAHQLSNAHRFSVLPSDPSPSAIPIGSDEYNHTLNFLLRDNHIIIVDSDSSAASPSLPAVIQSLNTLVLVTSAAVDGAAGVRQVLAWLHQHGYQDLISRTVLVVTRPSSEKKIKIDLDKLENHFSLEYKIPMFRVPYDPHLSEAGVINLTLLEPRTRKIFIDIAAAVAERLPS